jgi:hypothetical protein
MHHLGMNGNEIFIVSPKAVCAKWFKQVNNVTSGKKNKYVTVNVAVNAIGNMFLQS